MYIFINVYIKFCIMSMGMCRNIGFIFYYINSDGIKIGFFVCFYDLGLVVEYYDEGDCQDECDDVYGQGQCCGYVFFFFK